jgi:hypothetical protein
VSANFEPATHVAAYEARTDAGKMLAIEERIKSVVHNVLLQPRSWLAAAKYASSRLGFGSGLPISPTEPLNEAERQQIDLFFTSSRIAS